MKNFFYRVLEFDTLKSVAEKFNVHALDIITLNGLKGEIEGGDVIEISLYEGDFYVVQPQDTFYSLSKKLGVDERVLREKNKMPYIFYGVRLKY